MWTEYQERLELEAEWNAKADYIREAFGDQIDHNDPDDDYRDGPTPADAHYRICDRWSNGRQYANLEVLHYTQDGQDVWEVTTYAPGLAIIDHVKDFTDAADARHHWKGMAAHLTRSGYHLDQRTRV